MEHLLVPGLISTSVHWGGFRWTGNFTAVDLVAATTNALNGALLARRPDHYKQFTAVGIVLMAVLGGIGGGVTRDLLAGQQPAALKNPAYLTLCLAAGIVGYAVAYDSGQLFREGLFQFMTTFSLPWYAIVGAQKGVEVGYPVWGCLLLAVAGPTAGRYYIDITSGVTPKQFIRGEWFVGTALLVGLAWILVYSATKDTWLAAGVGFVVGYGFRSLAMFRGWEEPLASEPEGVVMHDDRRPLLGRKLKGKSKQELRDLGLTVEDGSSRLSDD